MANDNNPREGRPVEPQEARAHGNDPDTVRIEDGERDSERGGRGSRQESAPESSRRGTSASTGDEEAHREELNLRTDPGQDAGQWRAKGPLTETYARGGHGAWLDSDNEESGSDRGNRRRANRDDRGTSVPGVIFGWLASLGAAPILFAIIGAIVGGIVALLSLGTTAGGITSLVGFLVALFLIFLIGGYVAGRLASRQGLKHGLLVPLLVLILLVLLTAAGGALGSAFSGVLSSAVPSGIAQSIPTSIPQGVGVTAIIVGVLALLLPFLGGAIGGLWGARTGQQRP